jgi:hypothetical protein
MTYDLSVNINVPENGILDTKGKTYEAKQPLFKAIVWDGKQETIEELQKYLDDVHLEVNFRRGTFELRFRAAGLESLPPKQVFVGDVFVFDDIYNPMKGSFGFYCMKPKVFLKSYREITS